MTRKLGRPLTGLLAAAIIVAAADVRAEPLGRLFTTPEERAMLERLRNAPPQKPVIKQVEAPPPPPPPPEPPPAVPPITVKGVVARSGGEGTAWINDTNTLDGDLGAQNIKVNARKLKGAAVPIELPDAKIIELKPGQTYTPPQPAGGDFGPDAVP